MALTWSWNGKIGEAVFDNIYLSDPTKELTINLYEGNALLIMINGYKDKETGKNMYDMFGFFCDKTHMNNCLGLTKGHYNIYAENGRLKRISFNKAKSKNYKTIIPALVKAFDDIEIKIYTEEDEEK